MTIQKCPLCGGRVNNSVCSSCGYEIPDEESISAMYDYDPSNDVPPEEKQPEKLSEYDMPSVSPLDFDNAAQQNINIKAAAANNPPVNQAASRPAPRVVVQQKVNAPVQRGQNVPPAQNNPQINQPANQTSFSVVDMIVKDVADFVRAHWWKFLLLLFVPPSGLAFSTFYWMKCKLKGGFENGVAAVFFAVATIWLMTHDIDILGVSEVIGAMLGY